MKLTNKKWGIVAAVVIVAVAVIATCSRGKKNDEVEFEMSKVAPANLQNSITATGSIEPVTSVTVGTQVSGIVSKLYVDYNSVVKKGQDQSDQRAPYSQGQPGQHAEHPVVSDSQLQAQPDSL